MTGPCSDASKRATFAEQRAHIRKRLMAIVSFVVYRHIPAAALRAVLRRVKRARPKIHPLELLREAPTRASGK